MNFIIIISETREMEIDAIDFLKTERIPEYCQLLLGYWGCRSIKDLIDLQDEDFVSMQEDVKGGIYSPSSFDFESRASRMKHLGFDYKSLTNFKILPMDLRRLKNLPVAATDHLARAEESKKKRKYVFNVIFSSDTRII